MLPVAGDRSAFWRIAVANKILLYVAEPLREQLNPSELATVADYKFRTFQVNSTLLRESLAVCATLQAIQTPFIYMKGPLQQRLVYGDFFTRPVADIDILLPRRDHRRAAKSLEALGYNSASTSLWWRLFLGEEHLVKQAARPTTIDLHYRLQQPGSPAPRRTSQYLQDVEKITFGGTELPALARRNIPLLSAISIAKGLYNREATAAHVCDLFVLLQADPVAITRFIKDAKDQGLIGTALLALRAVSGLFGVTFQQVIETASVLTSIPDTTLTRMILTPDDPDLVWPMRRQVLWELCLGQPAQYSKEVARALASEAALRLFEGRTLPDRT
jgi:hypothetical protein